MAQVTFSLMLLVGAGLLLRTLWNLQAIPIGFQNQKILLASVDLDLQRYDRTRGWQFYDDLLGRIESLPGVESVALVSDVPLGAPGSGMGLFIKGDTVGPHLDVAQTIAGPGYFATLKIPMVQGRDFTVGDRRGAPGAVIVNETMERKFWPATGALGEKVSVSGPQGPFYQVVGVVGDHQHASLREEPKPHLYWSHRQLYGMMSGSTKTLVVRTSVDPLSLVPLLRSESALVDPGTPLFEVRTLSALLAETMTQERQSSWLLLGFSAIALLLAAIGLFGVISGSVRRRRQEMGIRMALGARPRDAVGLLVRQGLFLTLTGIGPGLAAAMAMGRFLRSQLFQVSPADPIVLATAAALLLMTGLVSSLLPAVRTSRQDPVETLRYE